MPRKSVAVSVIIGSTLMALSLVGSIPSPANFLSFNDKKTLAELERFHDLGKTAFSEGHYQEARAAFWTAAKAAMRAGLPDKAARDWSNAGFAGVTGMQYRSALEDLTRARASAEACGAMVPLIRTLDNLASLYLQMGEPEQALRIARSALAGPAGNAEADAHAKLFYQEAQALAMLGRLPEADPIFRQAIAQMLSLNKFDAAARSWTSLGGYLLHTGRYQEAESALEQALHLVRLHNLKAAASVLTYLAELNGKRGNAARAEHLFQQAFDANESVTPRWVIYLERGRFRLDYGVNRGALEDFREARRLALRMRAGIVPVDEDRIGVENRINGIFRGLVAAGNRLSAETHDKALLSETFDAAEQDRLWSLRSLIGPEPAPSPIGESPLQHARSALDSESVLLSFSISENSAWLWAVDRRRVAVYALPPPEQLREEIADFTGALRHGGDSTAPGLRLYKSLFGAVPSATLAHKRWLLELDGPLHDLPFAALPVEQPSTFLIERVALQSIPGALLLQRSDSHDRRNTGTFLGVGDPVFNMADPRYRAIAGRKPSRAALPRLPNTAAELEACSRAWGSESTRLLTGSAAGVKPVELAMSESPAIIHFATHMVSSPSEFGSGLIALGIDGNGTMELLGPTDILARRVDGSLIVMNGCHSAQGDTLPGSGLMGLTRAWIGAGAKAVVSTRWDVPDDSAQSLMVNFYKALRGTARGNPAYALREAQLAALHSAGPDREPLHWAGYELLSRN